MPRLSGLVSDIKPSYDVVIVGSGYGGAIAASRFARAGNETGWRPTVCVLERGREFQPGEYPDSLGKMLGEFQISTPGLHLFSHDRLFDLRLHPGVNVLVGCGLGGTSLLNANVALRADDAVFLSNEWPSGIKKDLEGLKQGRERALDMLDPRPLPDHYRPLKLQALDRCARHLGAKLERPPLTVSFENGVNHVGVRQHACTHCGDCFTGCNYAAKNTLIMNYLPDAKTHGAEIFTEIAVRRVEERGGRWTVHYELLGSGRERFAAPAMSVSARVVVLAAGTMGSTEILLRSTRKDPVSGASGLSLSRALGSGFSSNADVLAVSYNGDQPVEGIGFGPRRAHGREPVGPTITGMVRLGSGEDVTDQFLLQDGAIPGAMAAFLPGLLLVANVLVGRRPFSAAREPLGALLRRWLRCLHGAYRGAVRSTQTFLVMGHDAAKGVMRLGSNDRLRVEWPRVARQPVYAAISRQLAAASRALGGSYVRNPVDLFAVHPLGGCRMGDSAADGVVDHEGRVFRGEPGRTPYYEGLYVSDGSVVPSSLGVNPLLTISSLAERMCTRLADRYGWKIHYDMAPGVRERREPPRGLWFTERPRPGLQFTERMVGSFADPARARDSVQRIEATLTMLSDDIIRMLSEPHHEARLVGTVVARSLADRPLTVRTGTFRQFEVDRDHVETRKMVYDMTLTSDTGHSYRLVGEKVIRNSLPWNVWRDLTTLHFTIESDGVSPGDRRRVMSGEMRVGLLDFLRQMSTIRSRHAHRLSERFDSPLRFLHNFVSTVWSTYGRVLAGPILETPDIEARTWRMRAQAEPPFDVPTPDGSRIQLTRYRGDPRKPVILSPGLGVAASSYAAETVEQNLVDYLHAKGFDVWLLDYRASPVFPTPFRPFTIDDIAIRDWPTAIDEVRARTGQDQVQIMAHCVSSIAIVMGLLGGAVRRETVRSLICSQVAAHPIVPPQTEIKVAGHLVNVLGLLGVRRITAAYDPRSWRSWLLDQVLRIYPTRERCNSPVCRRILFIFHESFRHAQLNTETHDSMWRWYGSANLTALTHLASLIRKRALIDAEGNDVYMGQVRERLNLPIALMSGSLNRAFVPDSTNTTCQWLKASGNDPNLYDRKVFDGYGHMDCFVGKRAAHDIYEWIAGALERRLAPELRA